MSHEYFGKHVNYAAFGRVVSGQAHPTRRISLLSVTESVTVSDYCRLWARPWYRVWEPTFTVKVLMLTAATRLHTCTGGQLTRRETTDNCTLSRCADYRRTSRPTFTIGRETTDNCTLSRCADYRRTSRPTFTIGRETTDNCTLSRCADYRRTSRPTFTIGRETTDNCTLSRCADYRRTSRPTFTIDRVLLILHLQTGSHRWN
ncbi:hypothetical protein J6590_017998 [Homalodisca vitripennis]|nr:hypothetical protein J6590_017998 [Homalodisca vitripennis]